METGRLKSQKDGRLRNEYGKLMNSQKFKFTLRPKKHYFEGSLSELNIFKLISKIRKIIAVKILDNFP